MSPADSEPEPSPEEPKDDSSGTLADEISRLVADFQVRDRNVRDRASTALRQIGCPAVPALLEALTDAHRFVRLEALWTLARIDDPRVFPALISALKDRHSTVRFEALERVKNDIRAIPAMLAAVKDRDYYVRDSAQCELIHMGGTQRLPLKVLSSSDLSPGEKLDILECLRRFRPPLWGSRLQRFHLPRITTYCIFILQNEDTDPQIAVGASAVLQAVQERTGKKIAVPQKQRKQRVPQANDDVPTPDNQKGSFIKRILHLIGAVPRSLLYACIFTCVYLPLICFDLLFRILFDLVYLDFHGYWQYCEPDVYDHFLKTELARLRREDPGRSYEDELFLLWEVLGQTYLFDENGKSLREWWGYLAVVAASARLDKRLSNGATTLPLRCIKVRRVDAGATEAEAEDIPLSESRYAWRHKRKPLWLQLWLRFWSNW